MNGNEEEKVEVQKVEIITKKATKPKKVELDPERIASRQRAHERNVAEYFAGGK